MKRLTLACAAAIALAAGAASAADAPAPQQAPVDYGQPSAWLCRPGRQDVCATNLDAMAVDAAGKRTPAPFKAAEDPKIDCFYVYPTVSIEPTTYADMTPGPGEARAAQAQAARFAAKCRVFAPIYRQVTLSGVNAGLKPGGRIDFAPAYADVRDAWRAYLANDNHGRGVILIGHSQGSVHLNRLLAEEIDGKPAQKLLVAAYLAGDYGYFVPAGKDVGATLKSVPLCRAPNQFGCALVWSTYAEGDTDSPRFFANNPGKGLVAPCTNPAALSGGRATLHGFVRKPPGAPADDPPWVELQAQISGECVSDAAGTVLRVRAEPGRYADLVKTYFDRTRVAAGWGLHLVDIGLTQGDLLDLAESQGEAWAAAKR
jgi:hypothetical protein